MADFPPRKNSSFIWYFVIRDADGDPVAGATALDVEFSIDGGVFADVAGVEVDEGQGFYSCPILAAEMNGDVISLMCKTSSGGAKTAAQIIYTATRQLIDLSFPTISGRSTDVTATGAVGIDWGNVENPGTTLDLSATDINLVDTTTTNTDMRGTDSALLAASAPTNFGDLAITVTTGRVDINVNNDKTGYGLGNVAHGGVGAVLTLERIVVASTTAGEPGMKLTGNTTGAGMEITGGGGDAHALRLLGTGSGEGIRADGGPGGDGANFVAGGATLVGMRIIGSTTGAGLLVQGGITGHGIEAKGGATSGDGMNLSAPDGDGINSSGGTGGHGMRLNGDGSGEGLVAFGGDTGHGIQAVGGSSSGDAFKTNVTSGNEFSGSLSGSVASVTADVGITAAAVDDIWDEVLTGATHNVVNSSGRRLRQIEAAFVITSGTAQAGTVNTITLAAGESSTSNIFNGDRVVIVGGTGLSEHGIIITYNGSTKVATMSQNWVITPDVTSEYDLVPADVDIETIENSGVAADNLMADYDGTGYAKANSTIGTATNLTTNNDKTGYSISGAKTTLDALNDLSQAQILSDATPFAGANINNLPEGIVKNAAFNNFEFVMFDTADHATGKTGLTVTGQRSLDGTAFVAIAGSIAEVGLGVYSVDLLAADVNGDFISLVLSAAGADNTLLAFKTSS